MKRIIWGGLFGIFVLLGLTHVAWSAETREASIIESSSMKGDIQLYSDPNLDQFLWHLEKGDIRELHDRGIKGEGITVAIVGTGINYNHSDLWPNVWVNPEVVSDVNGDGKVNLDDVDDGDRYLDDDEIIPGMFNGGCGVNDPDNIKDIFGFGSHMAGIVAGFDDDAGIVGIAPRATIMTFNCTRPDGSGDLRNNAIAIREAAERGADIIILGSGAAEPHQAAPEIEDAIRFAYYEHDVVVIQAAGIAGDDVQFYSPQNMVETITVAMANQNDSPNTSFSSYGARVDMAAPGVLILSTAHEDHRDDFMQAAGTAQSAAFVGGVAALIMEHHEDLNLNQEDVRAMLKSGGIEMHDVPDDLINRQYGYVRVHAENSINLLGKVGYGVLRTSGDVSGTIDIKGVATGENFKFYEMFVGRGSLKSFDSWTKIEEVLTPIDDDPNTSLSFDGVLMDGFDTSTLPAGENFIRLRVINDLGERNIEYLSVINVEHEGIDTNFPPTITPIDDVTLNLGDSRTSVDFRIFDGDDNIGDLTVTASSSNQGVVRDESLDVRLVEGEIPVPGLRRLHIRPVSGAFGTTSITVTVSDPGGESASQQFVLRVIRPVIPTQMLIDEVTPSTLHDTITDENIRVHFQGGEGLASAILRVGSSEGGTDLGEFDVTGKTEQALRVPLRGRTMHMTLLSFLDGEWLTHKDEYTTPDRRGSIDLAQRALVLSPDPEQSTGNTTTLNFEWSHWTDVEDALGFHIMVGSENATNDLLPAGEEPWRGFSNTLQNVTIERGQVVHVTLFTWLGGGNWTNHQVVYNNVAPQLNTLSASSERDNFSVSASAGDGEWYYWLQVYSHEGVHYNDGGEEVPGVVLNDLPESIDRVYIRLYYWVGEWKFIDYDRAVTH